MGFDPKDPNDVDDFVWDWSARLGTGETLSTAMFIVPTGLTKVDDSNTTTTATVRLSAGEENETYRVQCRVTTSLGRTLDHSEVLRVKSR